MNQTFAPVAPACPHSRGVNMKGGPSGHSVSTTIVSSTNVADTHRRHTVLATCSCGHEWQYHEVEQFGKSARKQLAEESMTDEHGDG